MSLKSIFTTLKNEGYVIPTLDRYLLSLNAEDDNRAPNVNAPSQAGNDCLRARYYSRTKTQADSNTIEPRTRRIFDNGTKVHERLQAYLVEQGILMMEEVPVLDIDLNIQGHTDGIIKLSKTERAVIEIKSINSNGFSSLKDARADHKKQGLVYLYCLERRRMYLRKKYPTWDSFQEDAPARSKIHAERYQHLKDGSKYTKAEKVSFQLRLHEKVDAILYLTREPITKVIFLYENKDTQDLKEFVVDSSSAESKVTLDALVEDYVTLNKCVEEGEIPERLGVNKSDQVCRWCNYRVECWG